MTRRIDFICAGIPPGLQTEIEICLEFVARNHGFASWRAARAASPIESDNFGSVPTSNAASDKTTQELLPYSSTIESWVVRRNDDAPLRFKGLLLGRCEEESHNNGQ